LQLFPDASPEEPVYLSCPCGERITLTAAPESWPIPCPECGKPVRVVDPETVRREPADEPADPRLLAAPGDAGLPTRPRGGALAPAGDAEMEPARAEEHVVLEGRSFTGKRTRQRVAVRPPEMFGMETLALALWLATIFAIMIGHYLLRKEEAFSFEGMLVSSVVFAAVTAGFVVFQGRIVRPALRAPRNPAFWLSVAAAGVPVGVGLVIVWFALVEESYGTTFTDRTDDLFRDGSVPTPLLILAVGILPGIFEELGFRGWMQSAWKLVMPPGRALVLTACIFAVVHLTYFSLGWLLPFALWVGWLRERSGSIWPGVIAHVGHNTAMVLLVRYSG
jgi:membrane protease YdiL (CAAX protease family)